jgi:hypothetical protein
MNTGAQTMYLYEFISTSGIKIEDIKSYSRYYFDSQKNIWMRESDWNDTTRDWGVNANPADISSNTMGGLRIFAVNSIVPLSASHFVVVDDGANGYAEYLAKTIIATDPSVATPVSAAEQIKTIQAERDAYTGQ